MSERNTHQYSSEWVEPQIRAHTKETIGFGIVGVVLSVVGEKIDNRLLLEAGAASAALAYILLGYAWGRILIQDAVEDAIKLVSKQAKKLRKKE